LDCPGCGFFATWHAQRTYGAALLGLTAPGFAQDSTAIDSGANGLPGDAIDPFSTTEQINNYVVDLTTISSSWGTQYGVAPIVKSSKADPAR